MGLMLSTFASLVAESNELPVPPAMYGLFALLVFAMMLGVLFAFRQAATKLPAEHNTVAHDEHGPDAEDQH
jgi:hypothetical protein